MKYLSNLLKQGTASLMFFVSLDGYRRAVINDNKVREYNILEKAGLRFGTKQYEETKQVTSSALKGRTFSDESKVKMRMAVKLRQGTKTYFFGKTHTIETISKISATKSLSAKITNFEANYVKLFAGNLKVGKFLGIGESTIHKYKKKNKVKYLRVNI